MNEAMSEMGTADSALPAAEDFSIVLGGPLYQMYMRGRLLKPPAGLVERRIAAFIVVTWLPLVFLTLAGGTALGGVEVPFFLDVDVHIRFLIALPLMIGAELLVHRRIQVTVSQFISRGIVAPQDRPRFDNIIASTVRLRNSAWVEIALLVASVTLGYLVWRAETSLRVSSWYIAAGPTGGERLTLAGWWYAFISLNFFRFVLFRWYFRLLIWYVFLWRVARLPLQLNALHPDSAGGLGFLANSVLALVPLLLAHTVTWAGLILSRILHEGMKLPEFQLDIFFMVIGLMAVALVPLTFFTPHITRTKREGLREYGLLAVRYVGEFRDKWLRGRPPEGEVLVGSADIQSLADLANSYAVIRDMGFVPIGKQAMIALAAVLALPFAPLLLTMIPLQDLVGKVIGKML
jgi:hypothetical protein